MVLRHLLVLVSPLAILIALASGGCSSETDAAAQAPTPEVTVVTVHRTPIPVTAELPGRTSAYLVAEVRARVDGIVQAREFQEGADVREGTRLYQVDPAPYRAAYESAQAQLARAVANVAATTAQAERDKVLVSGNAVSEQAYINAVAAQKQADADVAGARAAVKVASINLGYTDVMSPISGRIGTSLVTQGAYVQASAATPMATVQQIDPIYVDVSQTSVEGLDLRRQVASGQLKLNGPDQAKVRLVLEDGSEYSQAGTLEFTDITVDRGTGSVTVRALFPNPQHVLLPGMFVRARIDQGTNSQAILVPQDGVTHDHNGSATVLTVGADDKVAQKTVVASRTYKDQWVVESGLNEGDRVIVSGTQRVQSGGVVRAIQAPAPSPPPVASTKPSP
ncbi:MAG: efflux RND transporter periplasmic adaptor subunit [Gammaproteobacteria bacterium]